MDDKDLIGPLLPLGTIAAAIFALAISGIFIVAGVLIVGGILCLFGKFLLELFTQVMEEHEERKREDAKRAQQEAERAALAAKTAKRRVNYPIRASVILSLYERDEPATQPHPRKAMNDAKYDKDIPERSLIQRIAEQNRLRELRG
ncbi:MAG: hypothetical protein DI628_02010 [Blastochloris viridis]|uniref:Uncharacterized protein n=1 Tax=Blastochloris viridis TaxID=1079 RepID=A0A6N4R3V0_BLAVI|nr:MAG: hypothetical protein DI628_02010 [Blastochloris viridis]